MNTTVPADALSGPAVAAGPTTRLARIADVAASSTIGCLRMLGAPSCFRGFRRTIIV
jgi:hypothetical protein